MSVYCSYSFSYNIRVKTIRLDLILLRFTSEHSLRHPHRKYNCLHSEILINCFLMKKNKYVVIMTGNSENMKVARQVKTVLLPFSKRSKNTNAAVNLIVYS